MSNYITFPCSCYICKKPYTSKGIHSHYKEMNFGNHSLKQVQNRDSIKIKLFENEGWKVLIFEDRYHTPQSAFSLLINDS